MTCTVKGCLQCEPEREERAFLKWLVLVAGTERLYACKHTWGPALHKHLLKKGEKIQTEWVANLKSTENAYLDKNVTGKTKEAALKELWKAVR